MTAREFARYLWTQLTAMRTALVLLFALMVAAIPGSLGPKILPQRPNNPVLVREWIADHPDLGPVFDRLGLFDVYASPWFASIYLLLLVSLVGCIVPRIAVYARAVRAMPPGVPKRLDRLAEHAEGRTALTASEALDAGERWLVDHRYRVRRQGGELSGEIGYLRELGNLVFHLSILGILAGVAVSSLLGFKGSVIAVEGAAFSNTRSQYDDFSSGALFGGELEPFTLWVDRFNVSFERGSVQHGAARQFSIDGRFAGASGVPAPTTVEVNRPVFAGGTMVNLIGHGYAPVVTVTDAAGHVAFSGPVVFLPQDGNFTSLGVIKAPDARPQRLAFDAIFVPSQSTQAGVGPRSTFPDADNPMLWGTVWSGAPKVETGVPENVYTLDKTGLTQVSDGAVPASFRLAVGQTYTLPDGSKLTFDAWKRWTKLQISSTPGLPITYGSIGLAIVGVALSLFGRPRRLFARVTDADGVPGDGVPGDGVPGDGVPGDGVPGDGVPGDGVPGDGVRHVEVGGLDRADARAGLDDAVAGLAGALGLTTHDRGAQRSKEDA